jgi:hypothetical protein
MKINKKNKVNNNVYQSEVVESPVEKYLEVKWIRKYQKDS